MIRRSSLVALVLLGLSGTQCHAPVSGTGGAKCVYDTSIACTVGSCEGLRHCLADLSAFGPCSCGDGGSDGSAQDGGADSSGTDSSADSSGTDSSGTDSSGTDAARD